MKSPRVIGDSPIAPLFLSELMRRQGSLVLDLENDGTTMLKFLAKLLGISYTQATGIGYALLGFSASDLTQLNLPSSNVESTSLDLVATSLDRGALSRLGRADVINLSQQIATIGYENLTKSDRVYITLRNLGEPAHFTRVAETYNLLFPDDQMTVRNVHAILSRGGEPSMERFGIVWTGVKGTYALRENGYERPALGIFEAVTKIVLDKFEQTGRPVHISVITTELGKYRQAVNPASLALATGVNSCIKQVSKDYFIPKDPTEEGKEAEYSGSGLDSVLRQFQADHASQR